MTPAQQSDSLAQECADYAVALRRAFLAAKRDGRGPPASLLRASALFERAAAELNLKHIGAQAQASPQTKARAVPRGWKLVPEHPTSAMQAAWQKTVLATPPDKAFDSAYRAMLVAAPAAPQPPPLTDEQIEKCFQETRQWMNLHTVIKTDKTWHFYCTRAIERAHGITGAGNGQ